ncbi:hypothetical protein SKAU_G00340020 [Synaphobranchus kaupii]|uniref:Uncharacterized protein n=1 Tax=Synaphobranchus kaupii TaxID=118154 RepID=A0A9Q1EMT1_SYNKA|nr:hypothetical protein SKAU_G00340020 [Synaphobranchus kaupii]
MAQGHQTFSLKQAKVEMRTGGSYAIGLGIDDHWLSNTIPYANKIQSDTRRKGHFSGFSKDFRGEKHSEFVLFLEAPSADITGVKVERRAGRGAYVRGMRRAARGRFRSNTDTAESFEKENVVE